MRTFSLKDDCTLSGKRLHRDERRVEGGGYLPIALSLSMGSAGGQLISAHGTVEVPPEGMKKGEKLVPLDYNRPS